MISIRQLVWRIRAFRALEIFQPNLNDVLRSLENPGDLENSVFFLKRLIAWVRIPYSPTIDPAGTPSDLHSPQSRRLEFLLNRLDANPEQKERVARAWLTVLVDTDIVALLTQTGIRRHRGLISEVLDRTVFRLLPRPSEHRDLAQVFARVFVHEGDPTWLRELDPKVTQRILTVIISDTVSADLVSFHLQRSIHDALNYLVTQAAAIGLSNEVRSRAQISGIGPSPFLRLLTEVTRADSPTELSPLFEACRISISDVFVHLETHGVSLSLVYQLELLEQLLARAEQLVKLERHTFQPVETCQFVAQLIQSQFATNRLSELINENIRLVSRKIVERSGESGEHYITRSRQEYFEMLLSAAGGGLVTVFTSVLKFIVTGAHMALFFEGFFLSLNYSVSFLTMQAFHFTLATKQPSMTAPALAGRLKHLRSREQLMDFVEEIARITRSQLAAAIGNVGMVIPGAIFFDQLYRMVFHHPVLTSEYAHKTILSLHLLHSLTIPDAALTGAILWFGSISAGWIENWTVYHQIPEAIAQSRALNFFFGPGSSGRLSRWFTRNISGIAGNVFFGFYLGFTPTICRIFGLPFDVRHVTLSTGSLTFALCGLSAADFDWSQVIFACLGIVVIGLLNFGVSFGLALIVAMKARGIHTIWLTQLTRSLFAHFRHRPFDFIFPMDEPENRTHPS